MTRRLLGSISISVLVLALEAGPALGSGPNQASDPSANSPAGVMYSIPLDSARQDAAPHHKATHAAAPAPSSGSGGGQGDAAGAPAAGSTASPAPAAHGTSRAASSHRARPAHHSKSAVLVPGGQPNSLVKSSNGFGSSSRVPGLNGPSSPGLGAVDGGGSSAPLLAITLAVVVLLAGTLVGARAIRRRGPQVTDQG